MSATASTYVFIPSITLVAFDATHAPLVLRRSVPFRQGMSVRTKYGTICKETQVLVDAFARCYKYPNGA